MKGDAGVGTGQDGTGQVFGPEFCGGSAGSLVYESSWILGMSGEGQMAQVGEWQG